MTGRSDPYSRLAFVDLETTGATATSDRITEIGMVLVDGDQVSEWSSLVNPETPIPPFIEHMTGISDAMVAQAPPFAELAGQVRALLADRLFIAHNARFDYGFLKNEFRRLGEDFRAQVLCTVRLSRKLFPEHRRHGLDALIQRHSLAADGRHRALADAQLIHQFWGRIHEQPGPDTVAQAVALLAARPSLPPGLDPNVLEEMPEGPGVYLFYGDNDLPLYVGKSTDLRKRVLSHFSADHASAKEMALSQQVRRIHWHSTGGDVGAQLLEARLIKELRPIHNSRLRRNEEACSWLLIEHGEGLWKPERILLAEVPAGWEDRLFGLFKSAKEAQRSLTEIAELNGLCLVTLGLEAGKAGRPCFAHQLHKCKGACVGKESAARHSARLMTALAGWKLKAWPGGSRPAVLKEGDEYLLCDAWRPLGVARDETELHSLLEGRPPPLELDTYRILSKVALKLRPYGQRPVRGQDADPVRRR